MHWTFNFKNGSSPCRVNQASTSIGTYIYSFGGYCQNLRMSELKMRKPIDVNVLNTITCRWHQLRRPNSPKDGDQYMLTPYFRYGHTVVNHDSIIYLYGGRADWTDQLDNDIYKYETQFHKWSILEVNGTKPDGRDGHSACVIGNFMLIFGGYVESIKKFSNDIYEFDFINNTWSLVVPKSDFKPFWRDFHTATSVGNKMYIFGGRSDLGRDEFTGESVYYNDICSFDIKTKKWEQLYADTDNSSNETMMHSSNSKEEQQQRPCGRRSHTAINYRNKILLFGGFQENERKHFNDLYEYDPEKNVWSRLKPLGVVPRERRRHSCCIIKDRMFIFGGTGPKHLTDKDNNQREINNNNVGHASGNLTSNVNIFIQNIEPVLQQFANHLNQELINSHPLASTSLSSSTGSASNGAVASANQDQDDDGIIELFRNINNVLADIRRRIRPINRTSLVGEPQVELQQQAAAASAAAVETGSSASATNGVPAERALADALNTNLMRELDEFGQNVDVSQENNAAQIDAGFGDEDDNFSDSDSQDMIDDDETEEDDEIDHDLISFSDLHILDLQAPSLQTLCMMSILKNKIDWSSLSQCLKYDLEYYSEKDNSSAQDLL